MLRAALSLTRGLQRFAFPLFAGLAIGLMVLGRLDAPTVARLRIDAVDLLAPLLEVMTRPVTAAHALATEFDRLVFVYEENARLRGENARLLHWQTVARRLHAENRDYRALLSSVVEPGGRFVTGRIVGMSSGAFVRTAIVNAGRLHGVGVGQAVVTMDGMLGRIVEVGSRSARVLLLADLNSRIPVLTERDRIPAVLAGDNSDELSLMFVTGAVDLRPGQRLVTSGEGGMLPPGLPVALVTERVDGAWKAQAFVDPARVEHVRIVDYALPGRLPSAREAGAIGELW